MLNSMLESSLKTGAIYGIGVIFSWLVFWHVIYLVSGFHVWTISINNGILFNGVSLRTRAVTVELKLFRIRLWGNSRKIIMNGLVVRLNRDRIATTAGRSKSKKNVKGDCAGINDLEMLPSGVVSRAVVRFVLKWMPNVEIALKHTTIVHSDEQYICITYINFALDSVLDRQDKTILSFNSSLVANTLVVTNESKSIKSVPACCLEVFKAQTKFKIHLGTGVLHNVNIKLFIDEFNVLMFKIIELILNNLESEDTDDNSHLNIFPGEEKIESDIENSSDDENQTQSSLDRVIAFHNILYPAIEEIILVTENSEFRDFPLLHSCDSKTIKEYFMPHKPSHSIDFTCKSVSLNFTKLNKQSAGFDVLFDDTDAPFHLNISVQILKVIYSFSNAKLNLPSGFKDEVLSLPNLNITYKSNILDHLVKGKGFKSCTTEFFSSAVSPVLDLETTQLSMFIYNLVVLEKYLKLLKLKKLNQKAASKDLDISVLDSASNNGLHSLDDEFNEATRFDSDSDKGSLDKYKSKLLSLLTEYYPNIDTKFIIEKPRMIVKYNDYKAGKVLLIDSSFALLDFHTVTTLKTDYEVRCRVIHPCITYIERSISSTQSKELDHFEENILQFRSFVLKLRIMKSLKLKSFLSINEGVLDLSNTRVIWGVNHLVKNITKVAENEFTDGWMNGYLEALIAKNGVDDKYATAANETMKEGIEKRIFTSFPPWLLSVKLSLNKTLLLLSSTSVLTPTDVIEKLNMDENREPLVSKILIGAVDVSIVNDSLNEESGYSSTTLPLNSSSTDSSTLNEEGLKFWSSSIETLKVTISVFERGLEKSTSSIILSLPLIKAGLKASAFNDEYGLDIGLNFGKFYLSYELSAIAALLGSVYHIRETLWNPLKLVKSKVKENQKKEPKKIMKQKSDARVLKDLIHFKCFSEYVDLEIHLNDDFKTKLELHHMEITAGNGHVKLQNDFSRLLAESPLIENNWCRLCCIDKLVITKAFQSAELDVLSASLRFLQPHKFVVYKLFDNLSITIKVLKHLASCLKVDSSKKHLIEPKESKALNIPDIRIKSKSVSFRMEDDPFECELNCIYQLGRIEQRKRLEQYSLFDEKVNQLKRKTVDFDDEQLEPDISRKYYDLQRTISRAWIRKVKVHKAKLNDELVQNKKFLFGNESSLKPSLNKGIDGYLVQPPLISVLMSDFDLTLTSPRFDLKNLPQVIHDLGQGVPLETKYSMLFPTHLKLIVSDLRMHLRDYPIPLLYVPSAKNDDQCGLEIVGHLIICEALIKEAQHLRKLHVFLSKEASHQRPSKFSYLTIKKTLSTVKLFTDLSIKFNSEEASRFLWGQSYQFGIQQVMLNFDQFSKPPVDPSLKLGFWDKMKLIMHGKFKIETGETNGLEVAFKGSRDPYDLFDTSSGFVLSFKENVVWTVNEHDDLRLFFNVTSNKVQWYIPNYLKTSLLVWSRESTERIFLPDSSSFITSCFAYYLNDNATLKSENPPSDGSINDKRVVSLSGGVHFKVGFLLQIKDKNGNTTDNLKPHHQVQLFNPEYTRGGHDSYKGFRSDLIHMAITLNANTKSSYNCIHLSPGVFMQFFEWWKLFASNMSLPIRRGSLFGDAKKTMKFSQHLFTNKFQFNFKSLFISHIYRDETVDFDEDVIECVGVRAKMDDFLVDLHQRKERRILVNESLSRNQKIMKMTFNIGEVHLSGIDLRTISAKFDLNHYSKKQESPSRSTYSIFDNDQRWFDIEDYEEAFTPSLCNSRRTVKVHPSMYSKRFSYLRDTRHDIAEDQKSGSLQPENTHDCLLNSQDIWLPQIELNQERIHQLEAQMKYNKLRGKEIAQLADRIYILEEEVKYFERERKVYRESTKPTERSFMSSEDTRFNNKFVLICMFLKWNVENRNLLLRYIHFVQLKVYLQKYLSYESITTLEEIIDKNNSKLYSEDLTMASSELKSMKQQKKLERKTKAHSSKDRLEKFEQIVSKVKENEMISEDYLVEVIYPQIQLQCDENPDSTVLITSPGIDARTVTVLEKLESQIVINQRELEKRYGIVLRDANIFVLYKDDLMKSDELIFTKKSYGSVGNWPPWLGIEICKDASLASSDTLLVEKTSMMITFEQLMPLGSQLLKNSTGESDSEDSTSDDTASNESKGNCSTVSGKLNVDIPELIVSSTSKQYYTLYVMVLKLLFYVEPMSKTLQERLQKLKFSIDVQDLRGIHDKLIGLQNYYRLMKELSKNYSFRQDTHDNENINEFLMLNMEKGDVVTEIYLLMQSILSGEIFTDNKTSQLQAEWNIRADQVILHMLDDDRTPILDLALAHGHYRRLVFENGSNDNQIDIEMMQGFNLLSEASFPEFLGPLKKDLESQPDKLTKLLSVFWSMNRTVRGIRILEKFDIKSQPLNIKIDEITGRKLMKYIFPSGEDSKDGKDNESSVRKGKASSDISESEGIQTDDNSDLEGEPGGFIEGQEGINGRVRFKKESGDTDSNLRKQYSGNRSMTRLSSRKLQLSSADSDETEDEAHYGEMVTRSETYLSIISFNLSPISMKISIKCNKGYKRLLNVLDFTVKLPEFKIDRQVISLLELTLLLKKFIIKTLLSHSAKLLKNKLTYKKNTTNDFARNKIKSLTNYLKFTDLTELHADSRSG